MFGDSAGPVHGGPSSRFVGSVELVQVALIESQLDEGVVVHALSGGYERLVGKNDQRVEPSSNMPASRRRFRRQMSARSGRANAAVARPPNHQGKERSSSQMKVVPPWLWSSRRNLPTPVTRP